VRLDSEFVEILHNRCHVTRFSAADREHRKGAANLFTLSLHTRERDEVKTPLVQRPLALSSNPSTA
jgi:hypothetical protein